MKKKLHKSRRSRGDYGRLFRGFLQAESLEPRQLLAADTNVYSWSMDVNRDRMVTPTDALYVINELNDVARGKTSPSEGEDLEAVYKTDVDGDGRTSPKDAAMLINFLNGEGEDAKVKFRISADSLTGSQITTPISVGTNFNVTVLIQDIRSTSTETAGGVFAGYLDVLYSSNLLNFNFREIQTVSLTGTSGGTFTLSLGSETTAAIPNNASADAMKAALEALPSINPGDIEVTKTTPTSRTWFIKFGNNFSNTNVPNLTGTSSLTGSNPVINISDNQSASAGQRFLDSLTFTEPYGGGLSGANGTGIVDEAGAFAGLDELGNNEFELFHFSVQASAAGIATLTADPADDQDANAVLVYDRPGVDPKVPISLIMYGQTSVTITQLVTAVNDNASVDEDTSNNLIDVLFNDSITTTGVKQIVSVGTAASGTAKLDDRGTVSKTDDVVRYTPNKDFFGTDTFTYVLGDGLGNTAVGTVTVSVANKNDAPTISAIPNQAIDEDGTTGPLNFTVGDVDNDPLTVTAVSSNGTLIPNSKVVLGGSGSTRTVTVTPVADSSGASTISISVSDGTVSATTTFTVTVASINDAPVNSVPGTQTTTEDNSDEPLVFSTTNNNRITVSDVDAAAGSLRSILTVPTGTLTLPNAAAATVGGSGTGSVTVTGTINAINSALNGMEYRAPQVFTGNVTLSVDTNDQGNTGGGGAKSDNDNVTIDVQPKVRPRARGDVVDVAEDSTNNRIVVLNNDIPNVGAQATLKSFTNASHGTVTLVTNGTETTTDDEFSYTPDADFFGSDTFTYTINDTLEGTETGGKDSTGTVVVNVIGVNDAPSGKDDLATTAEDTPLTIAGSTLTSNDSPGTGESAQTLTVTAAAMVSGANTGTVSVSAGNLVFTPGKDFNGTAIVRYTATDNGTTNGVADPLSMTASVTITVTEVNDPPVPGNDSRTTAEDNSITISDLLANDSVGGGADESTQTLAITDATVVTAGAGSLIRNGNSITFTPAKDFNTVGGSPVVITYTLSNEGTTNGVSDTKTATGTLQVTVTEVNDAPIANPDTPAGRFVKNQKATILGSVLTSNDQPGPANESSQTLTVQSADSKSARGGTVEVINGNVVYTPADGVTGDDSFTITITDNGTTNGNADPLTATSKVSFTVQDFVPSKVSGRVFLDFDNDNQFDEGSDLALAGVEIVLTGTDASDIAVNQTVVTNSKGIYEFDNLAPSKAGIPYVIVETNPENTEDGGESADTNFVTISNDRMTFSIPADGGLTLTNVNFAELNVQSSFATLTRFYLASGNDNSESSQGILFGFTDSLETAWHSFERGWGDFDHASLELSSDLSSAILTVRHVNGKMFHATIGAPRLWVVKNSSGQVCALIRGDSNDVGLTEIVRNDGARDRQGEGEGSDAAERMIEMLAAARNARTAHAAVDAALAGDWNA